MKRSGIISLCLMLAVALFMLPSPVSAQDKSDSLATIYGKVTGPGHEIRRNVSGVTAMLVVSEPLVDTLYAVSVNGTFIFRKIQPQKVFLRLSKVGLQTACGEFELSSGKNVIYFDMKERIDTLQAASVLAEVPLSWKDKDTTIYNAAAVTVMEGESLRSLLEQLPGFRVSKSSITVDGENVKRVYINGAQVFGENPMTAVNVLGADEVSQIRVYDEQNAVDERRGLKHSRKDKVLDVVTKEHLLRLSEAGLLAEGGADETGQIRYGGTAAVAYYSEMLQAGGSVNASNASGAGMAASTINSGVTGCLRANSADKGLNSYKETGSSDIHLNKYWKDTGYGNSLKVSYMYSHVYNRSVQRSLTEHFNILDSPARTAADTSRQSSTSGAHDFNISADLMDTPLKSFFITFGGNISDEDRYSHASSRTLYQTVEREFFRNETTSSESRDYNLSSSVMWMNNDARKFHPTVYGAFGISHSDNLSWTVDTLATSFDRRQLSSDGFGRGINASAQFDIDGTIVNDEKRTVSIKPGVSVNYNRSKKKMLTTDAYGVEIPVEDLAGTYDFTWNDLNGKAYVSIDYASGSKSLAFNVGLRHVLQSDDERYPDGYCRRKTFTVMDGQVSWHSKGFSVNCDLSPQIPSIEQTRNRISDANPMSLTGGNPFLKPSYYMPVHAMWHKSLSQGRGYLYLGASGSFLFRPVVTKVQYFTENTTLDKWDGYEALAGAMLTTFENTGTPSWTSSINVGIDQMLLERKMSLNASMSAGYSVSPQYMGETLIHTARIRYGCDVLMSWRPSSICRFRLLAHPSYSEYSNDSGKMLSRLLTAEMSAEAEVNFAGNGYVSAKYGFDGYYCMGGIGSDVNTQDLNASIGWKFFGKSLTVALKGIDLLNRGSLYSHVVTAESSSQAWIPQYGRYFMLSITWHYRRRS